MASRYEWLIKGGDVVSGAGVRRADVGVADGKIADVGPDLDAGAAREVLDATGLTVFPGIIDAHNHPYYLDDIEQFSLSAAYGGITTLLAFAGRPLNAPVTDVVQMVDEFIDDGNRRCYLDFGLHVILTPADNIHAAVPQLFERGVTSYKIFLAFAKQKRLFPDDLTLELMQRLAKAGGMCMVHCENGLGIELLEQQLQEAGQTSMADYIDSRPAPMESEAVYRTLALADVAGCDTYIVHISAAESVDVIQRYRRRPGPKRYAETCTHYLVFDRGDQERLGGRAKISPPMREAADVEALWASLSRGEIDVVSSDCSGQTCASKEVGLPNLFAVASGIPGVEQMFPLVYDEAFNRRSLALSHLARVFCENPSDIFGLPQKGRLEVGKDADITVFDPKLPWTVRAADQHGNSDYTLYEGREILGKAHFTMQRGQPILRDGQVVAQPTSGQYLFRRPSGR